jgi:hypothetical protein
MLRARRGHHGFVLLEVVVALGILLTAVSMIGAAMSNANRTAIGAVERSRALMFTEQIIAYYDTGQFQEENQNLREVSGSFAEGETAIAPGGWGWSLKVDQDINVEGLEHVTIRVVEGDPDGPIEEQRPILVTHLLRAEKRNINLQDDFGLTESQLEEITELIPGGAALIDPTDFDPTSLARLDMNMLMEMLPTIMQAIAQMSANGGGLAAGALPPGIDQQQLINALGDVEGFQNKAGGANGGGQNGQNGGAQNGGPTGGAPSGGRNDNSGGRR